MGDMAGLTLVALTGALVFPKVAGGLPLCS